MLPSQCLISLTSVPRRFEHPLPEVLGALKRQSFRCPILLSLPSRYRKWGEAKIPLGLRNITDITVFRPEADYGPGTKLLGALEYIRHRPEISHVITVDDDMLLWGRKHIAYLAECASVIPEVAITIGGAALKRFPYRYDDGTKHRNAFKFVDAPAGYRCVVYPTKVLRESRLPFEFFDRLPSVAFNDDDAYFGILLRHLSIPLFALPWYPAKLRALDQEGGGTAVLELVGKDRIQIRMEIFQYAFSKGYLGGPRRKTQLSCAQYLKLMAIYSKYLIS
jgi:hypothetical protein